MTKEEGDKEQYLSQLILQELNQPGFPACYDVGYHDGYNNAVNEHHQFHNSCP